jgi:hypothetical protein
VEKWENLVKFFKEFLVRMAHFKVMDKFLELLLKIVYLLVEILKVVPSMKEDNSTTHFST